MSPLDLVNLTPLMERTNGRAEVVIGLIDGPVAINHPDLVTKSIREIPSRLGGMCAQAGSAACLHGTFVAGILCARRDSPAPAICPNCTLLVRSIFAETAPGDGQAPSATPEELAAALIETIDAGARVVNLSAALAQPSSKGERSLEQALDHAANRGVTIVAAAGNQGMVGSSAITRHPWVLPVIASDLQGRPTAESNLSHSVGRRGLAAPGKDITSLGAEGQPHTFGGTSAATPFVTGAAALLWSEFPAATATEIKAAIIRPANRKTIVAPLLDAWAAYHAMAATHVGR